MLPSSSSKKRIRDAGTRKEKPPQTVITTKTKDSPYSEGSGGFKPPSSNADKIKKKTGPHDITNIPYYTSEADVNKIGPSVAVCTELLENLGHEEMMRLIMKHGKEFIEANKYAHLPRKERERLEKEKHEKWMNCPFRVRMDRLGNIVPPCPPQPVYRAPEPGTIGVSQTQVTFHTNLPPGERLPPKDNCVLKLGKVENTQCITLQYEADPPKPKVQVPKVEHETQVDESNFPKIEKKKKKGKGKKKGKKGKKGKGKGKGKKGKKGKSKKGKKSKKK